MQIMLSRGEQEGFTQQGTLGWQFCELYNTNPGNIEILSFINDKIILVSGKNNNPRHILLRRGFLFVYAKSLLMLVTKEVIDGLNGIECSEWNLNEYR